MKADMWGIFEFLGGWLVHVAPATRDGDLACGHALSDKCHCEPQQWFNEYGVEIYTHKAIQ
jgi:hypothetical protein